VLDEFLGCGEIERLAVGVGAAVQAKRSDGGCRDLGDEAFIIGSSWFIMMLFFL